MKTNETSTVAWSYPPKALRARTAAAWALALMATLVVMLFSGAPAYAADEGNANGAAADSGATMQAATMSDAPSPAKRTIMLYVCGADLEEDGGMASINLRQILNSNFGNGEDVRFVVMTGGSYRWDLEKDYLVFPDDVEVPADAVQIGNPIFDEEVTIADDPKSQISGPYNQIWEAKSQGAAENPGKLVLLDGDGLNNKRADIEGDEEWMSDPQTLKDFISYSVDNFPAEKYDLILWDHGGGPTGGFAVDNRREQSWFDANAMTFGQILEALKDNEVTNQGDDDPSNDSTFDCVNFDACLMGSTEIALGIADYTDYYIASPETVPGRGQVYDGWLNELGSNPDASTPELGKKLIDDFIAYYDAGYEDGTRQEGTMALIDMKALMESGFVDALSTVGDALKDQVESGQIYDELRSVKSSIVYEGGEFYDLGNLVSHMAVSLWELDPDAVDDSVIDYSNEEYTDAAKTLLGILSNPDIIYAGDTAGIGKESRFFMDAEGTTAAGISAIRSSGLHLFFPPQNYDMSVGEYEDAILEALEVMQNDGRSDFLKKYVRTMYEFALVRMVGREVTQMVNSDGFDDKQSVDYDVLRGYWNQPKYPGVEGLEGLTIFGSNIEPYLESMFGVRRADDATVAEWEEELKQWLDDVVKQQAREAVSAKNVTAQSFVTKNGVGSKVTIADTRRRAVDSVRMDVVAELPAVRNYIAAHDEGLTDDDETYSYLVENGRADLPLGSIYATMDASMDTIEDSSGDFLRDYVKWFNDSATTTWNVNPVSRSWYAVKDASGELHVATNDEATLSATVPVIRLRKGEIGDHPELNLLGFTDGKLTQIYLRDNDGNARIIRASDLQTEMELVPALYIDGIVSTILPASARSFKVTPDNVDDIELVYTDVDNIQDIQDVNGDGDSFGFKYVASDIYGARIDISDQVSNPKGTLVDIRLAEIEPATYTGEALVPKVTYDGKTLEEGIDYVWESDSGDEPIVLPGNYGVTLIGIGDYADMLIGTFVVKPTDDDAFAAALAQQAILAELAKADASALEAGDADAIAAADAALASYNVLTDAQKTQIDFPVVAALLSVSQKAAAAKATLADKALADAKADARAAAKKTDLSKAKVTVAKVTYTGKALKPKVTVKLSGKALKAGADYAVTYANNKKAGTGVAVVKGTGSYTGAAVKSFTIAKAKNTIAAKGKTAKVKFAKLKNANVNLAAKKVVTVKKAMGAVTYKKASGNKKIAIAKNGKFTVKKGLAKGTYKVKVKMTAAGNANYKKLTKTVTFKVKVA